MQNIEKVIKNLTQEGFIILRKPSKEGEDIDVFFEDLKKAEEIVKKYGFIITNKQKKFIETVKYENESLVILEIANNLLRSSKIRVKIRSEYLKKYLENPKKNDMWLRSLRYLLSLRRDKKAFEFFNKNKAILLKNNFYLDYLENNPFKCDIDLELFFKNKVVFILKCLGMKYFFILGFNKLKFHINSLKNKKTIAIVGVDGAGKSSIIDILTKYNIKTIYMGFKGFEFEKFYKKIIGKNFFLTFLVHFFVFLENWIRFLKAKIYNLKGYDVVFDRYPKIEYQLNESFANKLIYNLFYKYFFPKVDVIMLYVSPNIILKRKEELSLKEIKSQQNKLKNISNIVMNNDGDICKTVNLILKIIYEGV